MALRGQAKSGERLRGDSLDTSGGTTVSASVASTTSSAINVNSSAPLNATVVPAASTSSAVSTSLLSTLEGTVTLDGSAVSGAKIHVVDTTNDTYIGSTTSDGSGLWSLQVANPGNEFSVFAQYDDGNTQYSVEANPYIT